MLGTREVTLGWWSRRRDSDGRQQQSGHLLISRSNLSDRLRQWPWCRVHLRIESACYLCYLWHPTGVRVALDRLMQVSLQCAEGRLLDIVLKLRGSVTPSFTGLGPTSKNARDSTELLRYESARPGRERFGMLDIHP